MVATNGRGDKGDCTSINGVVDKLHKRQTRTFCECSRGEDSWVRYHVLPPRQLPVRLELTNSDEAAGKLGEVLVNGASIDPGLVEMEEVA
jgi:hypothetical protein